MQVVKEALGMDRCRVMFSGAAPISLDTLKYFLSLDLQILELYGMSETCGSHTISYFGPHYRMGSVGRSIPGKKSNRTGSNTKEAISEW